MAHRTFRDDRGELWHVWSVVPTKVERREQQMAIPVTDDRRRVSEYRVNLGNGMSSGWLCFENRFEKRRLSPVPGQWEGQDDSRLAAWLEQAKPVHPRQMISARRDSSLAPRRALEEED